MRHDQQQPRRGGTLRFSATALNVETLYGLPAYRGGSSPAPARGGGAPALTGRTR